MDTKDSIVVGYTNYKTYIFRMILPIPIKNLCGNQLIDYL